MKEERINPNFNINAKYESMLENAKSIVEHYKKENSNSDCSNKVALAIDVVNYLPVLQSQLKAKEEVTTKLKECLEEMLNELKQNDVYDRTSYEMGQIITTECIITKIEELEKIQELEILSKGENK